MIFNLTMHISELPHSSASLMKTCLMKTITSNHHCVYCMYWTLKYRFRKMSYVIKLSYQRIKQKDYGIVSHFVMYCSFIQGLKD